MGWTKKIFFLIIGVFIPLTLGIAILELIFGYWISQDQWFKTREINIIRNIKINYNVEKIYGKKFSSIAYTRDKNGLRGSCSDPIDINILTIGGSTTDQRYISDGQTFQDILQSLLSNKNSNKKICVSNAGVDGHSTFGHIVSFRDWFPLIEELRPKYILFYVGINDAAFRDTPNLGFDNSERTDNSLIINTLRQKSAVYDLLRTLKNLLSTFTFAKVYAGHSFITTTDNEYIAINKTNGLDKQIKKNTKNFEDRFRILLKQARSYGAIPICVSQPHLLKKEIGGLHKGIEKAFSYESITYNGLDFDESIISLSNSMKVLCYEYSGFFIDIYAKKFSNEDFYDLVHMTPTGSKRLGNYLFEEFIYQKINF